MDRMARLTEIHARSEPGKHAICMVVTVKLGTGKKEGSPNCGIRSVQDRTE